MAGKTSIEWTECSWNPITGCTKISEGCRNCYAARMAHRLKAMGNIRYENEFEVTIHEDLIDKPLHWKKPKRIFVNSMSDLFHKDIPDEVIIRIFQTMNKANWHTFQILTKRSDRLAALSKKINWTPNIWMGVSIENKETIFRAEHLKNTNAAIKFISAEPLLESIDDIDLNGIDWLIVGGESGPCCRPLSEEWVVELQNLARKANTAFFFKQWGGINKKKNGSKLRGKYYKEYPKVKL
ncbi:MAG TPA: phage Gp37/Gp68 family protein [Ruminococcus sp.]|nr:phage Gp37/Gp68 family protein [Ruminococcus sp.]